MKRFAFYRTGPTREQARLLGCGLAHGYFMVKELDETRLQTTFTIGFWWFVIRIQLWRKL